MKKVSIVIPTYKRPDFLERAIDSILNQDYKNLEIIIVDDNGWGTPEQIQTYKKIEKYEDMENFKYIAHEKNLNGSCARNTGIKNSSGDYICFLDDDDQFMPNKVSEQLRLLESQDENWGACYAGHTRVYPTGVRFKHIPEKRGDLYFDILAGKIDLCAGSTLMIKREVINKVGHFDESFTRHQDIEFILRVSRYYKIDVAMDSLVNIFMHPDSNRSKNAEQFEVRKKYFLEKFNTSIQVLPESKQRYIFFTHNIDIAKQYLKQKNLRKGLGYVKSSGKPVKGLYKIIVDMTAYCFRQMIIRIGR
ncbi:glycosyltransferase family 2 protein [Priestia filamentosa]|uniref:glycosyltransferase family 2 protein n=1 Tax=Priestia filamentosa TaxID=1402861 RepID=UPI002894AB21|nr:glycosyltransferase family 2 protein [Priestia filamentosa]MDT3766197.1 glycosyltransferase family 2 protein [Priestia filamentosa]